MKKIVLIILIVLWLGALGLQTLVQASIILWAQSISLSSVIPVLEDGAQRNQGIYWTEGLSWPEIKEKAKRENKYIFLDCFTTWCGPCKMMDKNVYTDDSVGAYFNEHFISVKVQMDKTAQDNEMVKNWYEDAAAIARQYRIEAFPCFIFLSPAGKIVQMATGYKEAGQFINLAQMAIQPGKKYDNPYAEYDRMVIDYNKGVVRYDRMLYMIQAAQKFDKELAKELIKKYSDHVASLNARQRYTKDNIEFWSMGVVKGNSKIFDFFYKDGKRIDDVMKEKGYAAAVVDKSIFNEIILPFFATQNKNPAIPMTGMYMSGSQLKADSSETDWKSLQKVISHKYDKEVAKRNVLAARIEWYKRHWNTNAISKYLLMQLEQYPVDVKKRFFDINNQAWEAFLHSNDENVLNGYAKWMEKLIQEFPIRHIMIDTYANLLYKLGRKQEAISWEEKALQMAGKGDTAEYSRVVEQMKNGDPTYGVKPLL